ncbi:extracellular solute-binding protein [Demequina litorisediminis]|uniref:Extracellular solute-binding protein n=1 Tax=Demequina litorisediminis TaxID=1849022 RepID=A0ABQ6II33_9MICO|nr:extracellular solute-binding protein [Demequina litorisediminis]GMA36378.1 hypothetical protein GCM10025876_25820 [Demequina litorisediminis]
MGEQNFTLPYYFGSRLAWYRKDIYAAGGVEVPTTLADVTTINADLKEQGIGGFYMGGRDWRNGVSWIFANGGDLATYDGSAWAGALSTPEAIEGMTQWQEPLHHRLGREVDRHGRDLPGHQRRHARRHPRRDRDGAEPGQPAASVT